MPKRDWRSWHLVAVFALGSVVEWAGQRLREWAGDQLKGKWFDDKAHGAES
jgi:hypothetical protein